MMRGVTTPPPSARLRSPRSSRLDHARVRSLMLLKFGAHHQGLATCCSVAESSIRSTAPFSLVQALVASSAATGVAASCPHSPSVASGTPLPATLLLSGTASAPPRAALALHCINSFTIPHSNTPSCTTLPYPPHLQTPTTCCSLSLSLFRSAQPRLRCCDS